jgi:hypothetical protein
MGNEQANFSYSKRMDRPHRKGESRIYRHPSCMDELKARPHPDIATL